MSITRSISVAQTDYRAKKAKLLCRLLLLLKHCETGQGKTTMILPRYLSLRRQRARYTKELRSNEVEGGNMPVTCSIQAMYVSLMPFLAIAK